MKLFNLSIIDIGAIKTGFCEEERTMSNRITMDDLRPNMALQNPSPQGSSNTDFEDGHATTPPTEALCHVVKK